MFVIVASAKPLNEACKQQLAMKKSHVHGMYTSIVITDFQYINLL
jgi:hypothetical protein